MSSQTVSPAAAYNAAKALPWGKKRRQDWAVKKAQKYVSKVGHAKGLAEQITSLSALGLEGRKLKGPYLRQLRGWKKGYTGSVKEQAAEAAQAIGQVTGQVVDKGLEVLKDPTVQAGINAALVASGLPPINWGATGQTTEEALAVWQATTTEPIPAESDPELAEGSSSSKSSGGLFAAAAGALFFLPKLLGGR